MRYPAIQFARCGLKASAAQRRIRVTSTTLTVRGSADQLAMAEWLFNALDKPAVGQPPAQHAASSDYQVPGSADVARVYYLAHSETPQSLQEMLNLMRSDADLQQAFVCAGPRALALRGSTVQLGATSRHLREAKEELDVPPATRRWRAYSICSIRIRRSASSRT